MASSTGSGIEPIFLSVKNAAIALGVSNWSMYQLLNEGAIESRYQGRKRLVNVQSLRDYAAGLPTQAPEAAAQ